MKQVHTVADNNASEKIARVGKRTRFQRVGLSIQSKLLIMLLGVSLVSSIVVGAIGFLNGRDSLHDAAVDQLTTIRSMRAAEIADKVDAVKRDAALHSRNLSAQTISRVLNEEFERLQEQELSDADVQKLEAYYTDTFIPELESRTAEEYGDAAFLPESNAARYLQLQYTTSKRYGIGEIVLVGQADEKLAELGLTRAAVGP